MPAAAVGAAIGLGLAALIARLNPALANVRDGLLITIWLAVIYTGLLAVLGTLHGLVAHARGRTVRFREAAALHIAACFFLVFFEMLEPAHQMVSVSPHLTIAGAVDVFLLGLTTWLVFKAAKTPRIAGIRGPVAAAAALVVSAAVLRLVANVQEPPRSRTSAVRAVNARVSAASAAAPAAPAAGRVLMIAIDGLDWQTLDSLLAAQRLPAIADLLAQSRYYELDNLRYAYSAPIWSTMYTGVESPASGVYDFVRCRVAGGSGPILQWPRWYSIHTLLLSAEIAARTAGAWGSSCTPSDSRHLVPPVWTIAASQGKRTLVVNPLPFHTVPEHLEGGVFVTAGVDQHLAFEARQARPIGPNFKVTESRVETLATRERAQRASAVELLTRTPFDFVVYYTHFVDSVQHYQHRRVSNAGEGRPPTVAALDASGIAGAYAEVDETIGALMRAFGSGTALLVSDHGWTYHGDYEHFVSPMGVLAIAPSAERGPQGHASLLSVMPTVLSLLGLRSIDSEVVSREFLGSAPPGIDLERMKWLRSLGYLW